MNKRELILIVLGIILAVCVGYFSPDLPKTLDDRVQDAQQEVSPRK